jgi:hypothetical protein
MLNSQTIAPSANTLGPAGRVIPIDGEALLHRSEAAELAALSPRTLEALAVRGDGPPMVKIGRSVRYRRSTLLGWLAERERVSTTTAA